MVINGTANFNDGVVANNTPGGFSYSGGATASPGFKLSPEQAAIGAKFGGSLASDPIMSPYLTGEEQQHAVDTYTDNYGNVRNIYTNAIEGGGMSVAGPGTKSAADTKKDNTPEAWVAYRMSQGASEEQARREATNIRSDKSKKFIDDAGFKNFIKSNGSTYGLSMKAGKIVGSEQTLKGGFTSASDPIKNSATNYNQQVIDSLGNIVPKVANDVSSGIDFRGDIRNMLASEFGDMDAQGLTAQDHTDLNSMRAGYNQNIQDEFKKYMQQVQGGFNSRGIGQSNLVGRSLVTNVLDPTSRNLVNANAGLAAEENTRVNSAAARRSSRIQSLLSGASTLGSANAGNLTGSFVSPDAYGGYTDPQAGSFLQGLKTTGTGIEQGYANTINNILTTPTMPDKAGFDFGNVAGGALSGAAAGSMFGPVGAGIGGVIGGIGGMF